MIYEAIVFTIDPARRDEFVAAYGPAIREAAFPGFHGGKIYKAVDHPARVIVVNEWDSVEAHTSTRGSPPHVRFRAIIDPYQAAPPELYHYEGADI